MYLSRSRLIMLVLGTIFVVITLVLFVSSESNPTRIIMIYTVFVLVALTIFVNERAKARGTPSARRFLALRVLSLLLKMFAVILMIYNMLRLFPQIEPNYGQFAQAFFNFAHPFDVTTFPITFWFTSSVVAAVVLFSIGQLIDWGLAIEENTRHTATVLVERFRVRQNNPTSSD
jgi:hypothetical protein